MGDVGVLYTQIEKPFEEWALMEKDHVTAAEHKPLVVSIEMGYGHLRAAYPLADILGTEVLHVDRPPLATQSEQRLWERTRRVYESISRLSQVPRFGGPMRRLLEGATGIPELFPYRDMSTPTFAAEMLDKLIRRYGLGKGLAERMKRTSVPLLTTHFAPALAADRHGCEKVYCIVTDSDVNRIWAPLDPQWSRITYLAPAERVVRRLRAYGVLPERIKFTGFPLPIELLGGPNIPSLRKNLAARLVRLDPDGTFRSHYRQEVDHFLGDTELPQIGGAPLVTFAVGGAGAQAELVRRLLPSFRKPIEYGRIRLALVAGIHRDVHDRFRQWIHENHLESAIGTGIRIVSASDLGEYFRVVNDVLAETDVLWTKPSEMTFLGALGIPLVLSRPVGVHERYNRRWAIERGVALKQRDPRYAGERVTEWLHDGTLAAAAWSGFMMLPKFGVYRVLEEAGITGVLTSTRDADLLAREEKVARS